MKNLIIYYSRKGANYVNGSITDLEKGNTEIVAEYIQEITGGELFEVDTIKKYSDDYMTCTQEAKEEQKANARPELVEYLDDISDYENIFICGPCWWGTYPMAIFSLIERLDFAGKNIFCVMTHEGSGLGHCESDIKKMTKDATLGKGLAIHGAEAKDSKPAIEKWLELNCKRMK